MALTLMRRQRDRLAYAWRSYWKGPYNLSSITAKFFSDGVASATGVSVSEQTALTYSAFWACVNAISTDVASLPLILYKRDKDGGKTRFTTSKTYQLLHDEPNPEMTSMSMRQTLQAHALTWGGGFAEIERDQLDRPKYLWPITPDRVTMVRDRVGNVAYAVSNSLGDPDIIPAADMLHIPGLGFDGTGGYSVVAMARESIGLGLATERFGGTFFGGGSTFGGVLSFPGPRPPEMSDKNYIDALNTSHQGVERAHRFLRLYNGAKYERLGIPPNDAQFLETRLHQVEEMCRWFRMPPHKIQHLARSTNNNIEHQGLEYYTDTLRPWLVRWEQEINRKLIAPLERRQQFAEHNVDGLLRGDSAARAEFFTKMFTLGAYSINMILEKENLNGIGPSGDVHFVPLNMTPVDRVNEVIDSQIKAKETPAAAPAPEPEPEPDDDDSAARAVDALRVEVAEREAAVVAALAESAKSTADQVAAYAERATAAEAQQAEAQERLTAAQALVVARDAALAEIQVQFALRDAWVPPHSQDAELERLRAELDTRTREHDEAMLHLQTATSSVEVFSGAAERAEAALAVLQDTAQRRMTSVIAAHRGLIADAMGRMIRRETEKARRAQATPEKLRAWMEHFYPVHEDIAVTALLPAIRAHLAWKQSTDDPLVVTQGIVKAHIDESQRQLRLVLDTDADDVPMTLESTLRRWETERAEALADVILKEAVDHVSQR